MNKHFSIGLNTVYQFLSRASTAIAAMLFTRLLTSKLGVEGFGEYQIVLSFVSLFWGLTDFGMDTIAVREICAHEEKAQEYFSALLTNRFVISLMLILIALVALNFLPYPSHVKAAIIIASATIFFQGVQGAAVTVFQIKLAYQYQLISNLLGSIALFTGFFLVVQFTERVEYLAAVILFSYALMMVIALLAARKWIRYVFSRNWVLIKTLLKETLPYGLAVLFNLATYKIDVILLSAVKLPNLSNDAAVGIYNLSYKIFELATVAPIFFINVMYPILSRHYYSREGLDHKDKNFAETAIKTGMISLLAGLASGVFLYLVSPIAVKLLSGNGEFEDSIKVLQLLSLGLPFFYLTPLLRSLILIFRRQINLVYVYAGSFLFNFVANWIFLPRAHYFAAATITGLTEILTLILLSLIVKIQFSRRRCHEGVVL